MVGARISGLLKIIPKDLRNLERAVFFQTETFEVNAYVIILRWFVSSSRQSNAFCAKSFLSPCFIWKSIKRSFVKLIVNISPFFFSKQCSSSLLSARLKAFKMSLDQVEVVTKLLRASRNCNELLLKDCFKDILENGITSKDLNSTDKSGRVSQSTSSVGLRSKTHFTAVHLSAYASERRASNLFTSLKPIKIFIESASGRKKSSLCLLFRSCHEIYMLGRGESFWKYFG